jgi:UDP-N-acetylmuramoylalanine--D-glutamate ligase
MKLPENIESTLDEPIAILGWGVSGRALAELLDGHGYSYSVYDEKAQGENIGSEFFEVQAKRHKLAIFSPGFPQNHQWIKTARKYCLEVVGEMDFASLFWRGDIIAVTGTNGKTTICSFLSMALQRQGVRVLLGGNIGVPLSRIVLENNNEDAVVVCEVSSFQSEKLQFFQPDTVMWTNFGEDHLDHHSSMEEYFRAKWDLVGRLKEGGDLLLGDSVVAYSEKFGLRVPEGAVVISSKNLDIEKIPNNSPFKSRPQMPNYFMTLAFWKIKGYTELSLRNVAMNFKLAAHRLSVIGDYHGVQFWNDSKATNFDAVIAALDTFSKPVKWIGGGKNKGGDLAVFTKAIAPKIKYAYLIGEVSTQLQRLLSDIGVTAHLCNTLDEAVIRSYSEGEFVPDIVFSPGFSSFDMFDNYVHRGNSFQKAFLGLKNNLIHSKLT